MPPYTSARDLLMDDERLECHRDHVQETQQLLEEAMRMDRVNANARSRCTKEDLAIAEEAWRHYRAAGKEKDEYLKNRYKIQNAEQRFAHHQLDMIEAQRKRAKEAAEKAAADAAVSKKRRREEADRKLKANNKDELEEEGTSSTQIRWVGAMNAPKPRKLSNPVNTTPPRPVNRSMLAMSLLMVRIPRAHPAMVIV
jgi:hypothetical protein